MYKAIDIAYYILLYAKEKNYMISNLKLQKILYFIQAEFLVSKNNPCFSDAIEAWDFGPVVPNVYYRFNEFGSTNIFIRNFKLYEPISIDASERKLIENMVDKCNNLSSTDLVDITQHQTPWINSYCKFHNVTISNESIKEFFKD